MPIGCINSDTAGAAVIPTAGDIATRARAECISSPRGARARASKHRECKSLPSGETRMVHGVIRAYRDVEVAASVLNKSDIRGTAARRRSFRRRDNAGSHFSLPACVRAGEREHAEGRLLSG